MKKIFLFPGIFSKHQKLSSTKIIYSGITGVFLLIIFLGCQNFYKSMQAKAANNDEKTYVVDSLKLHNRYFILRNGSQSHYMKNIALSTDKKTLDCALEPLPANHLLHLVNGRNGNMRYKKGAPEDLGVLNEVHIYMQPDNSTSTGNYTLQLDKVQKIEIIEHDKGRTTASYVVGAIGYTLAAAALAVVIIAALKSSCPFVSAYDGNSFTLQGEIYGGAIYPQLARHDYLPLRMAPLADGSLQLKISNELQEHQFTDMAELWVITHDKNSNVFADEQGNLYSIGTLKSPTAASLNQIRDVTAALKVTGDNALLYMDDATAANATNEVVMQFDKPATATKGKLLLSLKNSYFLDLLYGELAKGFGNYYPTFIKKQQSKPVAELLKWTKEQQIPLEVSVKTITGWEKITDITTIGPVATRNMVIPIDLPPTTEAFTAIKLSSGFMFWEIDYAAIDYSADNFFTVQKINPVKATDGLGKNVLPDLQKEDGIYLTQPTIGNTATIEYNTAPMTDASKTQTYILHTKGYYEHVRDFKNKPNISFLQQFKKPNAFPLFGMNLYKKMSVENFKTLAKSN